MKCPYCAKEMERGFLKSSRFIHWGKERKLGFLPDDLKLTRNNLDAFFKGYFVESYYCDACRKIVVSAQER